MFSLDICTSVGLGGLCAVVLVSSFGFAFVFAFVFVFVFVFDKGALLGERRGACLMPFVDAF